MGRSMDGARMKRFPACWTAVRHVCSSGNVFFADPEAEQAVNTLIRWSGDVIQPQALALICASCQISDLRCSARAANAANPQN